MKLRFLIKQIIRIMRECAAGVKAQELRRRYSINDVVFYKYKAKFGSMNPSNAKKLRA